MENHIPLLIWIIRIHSNGIRISQCSCIIPKHNISHLSGYTRQRNYRFLDDIIAQAKTGDEHDKIVLEVLKQLFANQFHLAPN